MFTGRVAALVVLTLLASGITVNEIRFLTPEWWEVEYRMWSDNFQ